MHTDYTHTRAALLQRLDHHMKQAALISATLHALENDEDTVFELHRQQTMPHIRAVMSLDKDFRTAAKKMHDDWKQLNSIARIGQPEVFVRFGDKKVAIMPEDAPAISEGITNGFHLDSRIKDFPNLMVFADGDEMPSAWYASKPLKLV